MLTRPLIVTLLSLSTLLHAAEAPPGADIWVAPLLGNGAGVTVGEARNVTARAGYDNQPTFVSPQVFLFTSFDAANGQTDAWRHDLAIGAAKPLLVTPESEYSPTPVPGGGISVVRVALDGTQQLWWRPPHGNAYELLFPLLEGVGYHAWIDEDRVALFMLRESMELHIANRRSGEVMVLAKDIGRSLQVPPSSKGAIAFVEPGHDGRRWIKRFDLAGRRITPLAPVLEGSEDFVFLPDGRLLMARERALFVHEQGGWLELAQFEALPGDITRLAVSPDGKRIAMVAGEED